MPSGSNRGSSTRELVRRLQKGERRALSLSLSLVEDRRPEARELLSEVYRRAGRARIVGITGPPGVGKSTLADALAREARARRRRVAILAIDPTSPISGGALLGDRARMERAAKDPEVFIRSMATRGHVGGLAGAAFEAIMLLEAAGYELVLVETVGAGQDEIEVASAVGRTVVVLAPGMGDGLQAGKAGLLEVADLFVVNKADRQGADRLEAELMEARGVSESPVPIVQTIATTGTGVERVLEELDKPAAETDENVSARRRSFIERWLRELVIEILVGRIPRSVWEDAVKDVLSRASDPFSAAEAIARSAESDGKT